MFVRVGRKGYGARTSASIPLCPTGAESFGGKSLPTGGLLNDTLISRRRMISLRSGVGRVGVDGLVLCSAVTRAIKIDEGMLPTSIVSASTGQNLSVLSLDQVISWKSESSSQK